jgi:hypothetical protein
LLNVLVEIAKRICYAIWDESRQVSKIELSAKQLEATEMGSSGIALKRVSWAEPVVESDK